ncbi:Delta(3,5)-Delta(2,4)-dienoyl-CoA isomerase, mitochondrial [Neolecta irregularis DAH-3]|uniref:Delta(3,5)-Delta(2,4)-dienoyl-CoA isomerase, mitochondrial n=1 Tax=Neolecta irregularis (strain DAH-3) TaxID=1198029 RepID=A0A1U7LHC7_NEOID|nr:Delta(3,5)-Delta(2,4)-dienoyl-CoA isomerase, mitochondrial [Neolecta irregularis DAH-3]|eukprot:OLL22049.1 Delta(3,5)-Delta(2,4)-dienoyl-CoA isomerase, mitochondrial [Neolecta irregularis DAH-3]
MDLQEYGGKSRVLDNHKMHQEQSPAHHHHHHQHRPKRKSDITRVRYKVSFRKKYHKMRMRFDIAIKDAEELQKQVISAKALAKRIAQENAHLLDLLVDTNDKLHTSSEQYYDVGSPRASTPENFGRPKTEFTLLPPGPDDELASNASTPRYLRQLSPFFGFSPSPSPPLAPSKVFLDQPTALTFPVAGNKVAEGDEELLDSAGKSKSSARKKPPRKRKVEEVDDDMGATGKSSGRKKKKSTGGLMELWRQLESIFDQTSKDPDVRAVVLTAKGRAFTAGLDIKEVNLSAGSDPSRTSLNLYSHITEFQRAISSISRCRKPVICVIHGIAFGGAIDIACAADIRLSVADARFSVKEVDIGLAADLGSLQRMQKIVGNDSWVREVSLTAREFGAEEAFARGFVSRVAKTKNEAMDMAITLAVAISSKSPIAVQGTKHLMNYSRDHSISEGLEYAAIWNSVHLQNNDVSEAMVSTLNKRKPTFEKL